jgi:hypothetical protein
MASSQDGNIGIWSGYTPGDNGWTAQHNSNWDALDALVQCTVKNSTTTTPPGSPANGDAYIVPSGATGAWASQTNKIAVWVARSSAWVLYTPKSGWVLYDQGVSTQKVYNGSAWSPLSGGGGGSPLPVNAQTGTAYTLALTDAPSSSANQGIVTMNNASANTVTVPPNSSVAFPVGTQIMIPQLGAGQTSVAAGSGVTVSTPSTFNARTQYSAMVLTQIAANSWVLGGDIA